MNIMKKISVQLALIGVVVFLSFASVSTAYAAAITSITVSPSDVHAKAGANYTINFTLPDGAATTTHISFTFSSGFDVSGAGPDPITVSGMAQKFTLSVSGQIVGLATTTAGSATTSASQSVTITGPVNPQQDGGYTVDIAATTTVGAATGTSATFYIQKSFTSSPTDTKPPVSKITKPVSGATIPVGQSYIIEGTGTDNASIVDKVEVSIDDGKTWVEAKVNSSATALGCDYIWSYVWANPIDGEYIIKLRATDAKDNLETAGPSVKITVGAGVPAEKKPEVIEQPPAEKPITEMNLSELKAKIFDIQQQLITLLQQLLSLLQQQIQDLTK